MEPLRAEIRIDPATKDSRGAIRRTLRLQAQASSGGAIAVLIHNLSRSGLMIETSAELAVGDIFQVELPEAGPTATRVVWSRETLFGCEFLAPVSKAAVSAALLLTPAGRPDMSELLPDVAIPPDSDRANLPRKVSPAGETAATLGLVLLLFAAILFIAALLRFPFSAEQTLPFS